MSRTLFLYRAAVPSSSASYVSSLSSTSACLLNSLYFTSNSTVVVLPEYLATKIPYRLHLTCYPISCRRLAVQHLQQTSSSQSTLLDRQQHAVAHDDRQQHGVVHDDRQQHAGSHDDQNSDDEDDENMDVCVVDDKPEADDAAAQSDSSIDNKTVKDTTQLGNYM